MKRNVCGLARENKNAPKKLTSQEIARRLLGCRVNWAKDDADIQENTFWAHSKFCSLELFLLKDESLEKRYEETIKVDLQSVYVPKLTKSSWLTRMITSCRLCHKIQRSKHASEETLTRFGNAAEKWKGETLNGKLLKGTNLLRNLIGIIFRFREHQIVQPEDIQAMILPFKVPRQKNRVLIIMRRNKRKEKIGV